MLLELWHDLRYRVRALRRRGALERELEAELQDHLDREAALYARQGVPPAEARRRARIALGSVQDIKERSRVARGTAWLESVAVDVRQAFRMSRASPGFAIGVCLTLALGIGANAAVFSAVKGILLTPLPYRSPDRLVVIEPVRLDQPGARFSPTVPEYLAWRERTDSFAAMATLGQVDGDLAPDGGAPAETVVVQKATASMFAVLGVAPEFGRPYTAAEDRVGTPSDVVVISHRLWQRRYGGVRSVIGRVIHLDGAPQTIVGVMPDGFGLLHGRIDVWAPQNWNPAVVANSARGWPVVARLKDGVTFANAQADLDAVSAAIAREAGGSQIWGARLRPLHDALFGNLADPLTLLQGIVGLVFLIACANVTGLVLLRTLSRRAELAIRAAVGAGPGRLVRQWVTEFTLLALAGALVALVVARVGLSALVAALPVAMPGLDGVVVDGTVLLFTLGLSLAAIVICGALPALWASRANGSPSLRPCGRHVTDTRALSIVRTGLVSVQVALATVLLAGTGLLAVTLVRIGSNDVGGDPDRVLAFTVRFPPAEYRTAVGSDAGLPLVAVSPEVGTISSDALRRIERVPGVEVAAVSNLVPFSGRANPRPFRALRHADTSPSASTVNAQIVTRRYFETLGIRLVRGRGFSDDDTASAPWVAVVSEGLAASEWPGVDPIGEWLRLDVAPDERPRQVIGIAADTLLSLPSRGGVPTVYTPYDQQPDHARAPFLSDRLLVTFLVRASDNPTTLVPAIRRTFAAAAPDRPPVDVHRLTDDVAGPLGVRRSLLVLLGTLGFIATLVAGVGVCGAVGHHLARRTREIGIRLALGASRRTVWRLALGQVGWILAGGLTAGVALAMGLTRFLTSLLWGVTPTDAPTYAGICLFMTFVAVAAALGHIRRALRIEPTVVLEQE